VVLLIFATDALEDRDRILDRGWLHFYGLEAPIERGVLLDVLAVLVERGRTDALEFTTGERGFEDVGGIHRALGRAGADDRVHLVDEQNHVFGAFDLVHHSLDALLELAAVFGAGNHECEVERDDTFVDENLGDDAAGDLLSEAFHNCGFAHTSLTDEYGIVFRAAAKDLDHTADLVLAADDGVEFALPSQFREVAAKRLEGGSLDLLFILHTATARGWRRGLFRRRARLGRGAGKLRVELAKDFLAGAFDVNFERLEHAGCNPLTFPEEPKKQMLGPHVGVIERFGLLTRQGEDFLHARGVRDTALGFRLGAHSDLFLDSTANGFEVETEPLEYAHGDALPQFDQAKQNMLGAHVIVMETIRFLACKREHLLGTRSEVVHWLLGHVGKGELVFADVVEIGPVECRKLMPQARRTQPITLLGLE